MTTNVTWVISQLDRNAADGGVFTAHWSASGTEQGFTGSVYGTTSFTYDASSPNFKPYDQLTEMEVLQWVFDAMGADTVQAHVANVTRQINDQINPPVLSGTPW